MQSQLTYRKTGAREDNEPEGDENVSRRERSERYSHRQSSKHILVTFEEMPEWYRDNPYIRHGYRPISHSSTRSFASWAYFHNETVNIYSHFLPALAVLLIASTLYGVFVESYPRATITDKLVLIYFLTSVVVCFAMSAFYHTLSNHSERVCNTVLGCDYMGILALILGDFVSGIRVGFFCEPSLRNTYWMMILTLGISTGVLLLSPRFVGPKYRTLRLSAFITTGFSAIAPIAHGIVHFGLLQLIRQSGLIYYLIEANVILAGALAYGFRFPETFAPGQFDYYGSSHQIFHILVVIGTAVHFMGLYEAYNYNYQNRSCGLA